MLIFTGFSAYYIDKPLFFLYNILTGCEITNVNQIMDYTYLILINVEKATDFIQSVALFLNYNIIFIA